MSSRDACGGLVAVAALLLGLWSVSGQAELGGDDYLPSSPGLDEAKRARVREEIEAERRRAAERAEQVAPEQAAEQARRQAALAAEAERKPEGERLVEIHCLRCHAPERIAATHHTWLGWQLSVQRMRLLNGAQPVTGGMEHHRISGEDPRRRAAPSRHRIRSCGDASWIACGSGKLPGDSTQTGEIPRQVLRLR